jgi:hypothetical protein
VIGAVVVDFVPKLLEWHAILALLVRLMLSLALLLDLNQIVFEALML